MFEFTQQPLGFNVALFAAGAAVVWFAGTRLTRYADAITEHTGLGQALIGALLLGGITSLPELATTSTAAIGGNGELAVNNILGGVAMQLALLAVADAFVRGRALSTLAGSSSLLLQGNGLILILALAVAAITSGSVVVLGIDLWTAALLVVAVGIFWASRSSEHDEPWPPADDAEPPSETVRGNAAERLTNVSNSRLTLYTILAALPVVLGGYLVARTGEAVAEQSGLGASFGGAILLAIATSLPEVSTTLEAVRLGRYRLAFSNIFGTNIFDVGFLFIADVFYRQGGVLESVGDFSVFAAMLGILLTGVYLAGILQRSKRVVFRIGLDSILVAALYLGGVVILYGLR